MADRSREFASLRGGRVESWIGVEWALRENLAGSRRQFDDPEVPCRQLRGLQATLDDGHAFSVRTYQHDTVFGLWHAPGAELQAKLQNAELWDGVTRWRSLSELPTGMVDRVIVVADEVDDVLAEVHLRIGGQSLLLMAGELIETVEGGLSFHRLDESVLAFTDPAAAKQICVERRLADDAQARGWDRGVQRHHRIGDRIRQLLDELGEPL